jgi:hypothetical protein
MQRDLRQVANQEFWLLPLRLKEPQALILARTHTSATAEPALPGR